MDIVEVSEIGNAFRACGISSGDVLMLHSDAGVAAEMPGGTRTERFDRIFDTVLELLGPSGTLVVPTFTYSLTSGEVFDPRTTPSTVGLLGEHFRKRAGVLRSLQPIFSVAAVGSMAEKFALTQIADCFGPGSAFDLLYQANAWIACMACPIDRMTMVHYVEQSQPKPVDYRYFKTFHGQIATEGGQQEVSVRYLVRNMERRAIVDLTRLRERLLEMGLLQVQSIGRFELIAVRAHDFHRVATQLLSEDPVALIQEGRRNPQQPA